MIAYDLQINYEHLYHNAPCGFFIAHTNGQFINLNNTFSQLLGLSSEMEISNYSFQDFLSKGGKLFYESYFVTQLHLQGVATEINFELCPLEGSRIPVLLNAIYSFNDGYPTIQGIVFDIRQRKQYENELKIAQQKATELSTQLSTINNELQQFAYSVSHDLKEPLRSIKSILSLLQKRYSEMLDAKANDYIDLSVANANRMENLIVNLLEYATTGGETGEKQTVDFNKVIDAVKDNLDCQINESNAEIIIASPLPTVSAYAIDILRLFQNLLSNAIKFARKAIHPVIEISAIDQNNHWQISIKDNGVGIAVKNLEKIFDIFTRLNPKENYSGTGIGLAMCKKIVTNHGGKIWVDSAINEGSTFYFTLAK